MIIKSKDIKDLLRRKHEEDVFVEECHIGFGTGQRDGYIDAWSMKKSWAHPLSIGYEIKINRRDFIQDEKWIMYLPYCNQFYFVAPREVIKDYEVPDGCGLIIVSKGGKKLYTKVKAPRKEIEHDKMELLYKGILMNRTKILDKSRIYGSDKLDLEYWEKFIKEKEKRRCYGGYISGKIRSLYDEKIEKVNKENGRLKKDIEIYESVKKVLDELGVDCVSKWSTPNYVKKIIEGEDWQELKYSVIELRNRINSFLRSVE